MKRLTRHRVYLEKGGRAGSYGFSEARVVNVFEPGQKLSTTVAGVRPDGDEPFDFPEKNVGPPRASPAFDDENHTFIYRSKCES
jgi:hypothetical protein